MKWMLVVLVGGVSPVNTDLVCDKFSDCLAAEEQMRQHYADAFDAWDRMAATKIDSERSVGFWPFAKMPAARYPESDSSP